MEKEKKDLNYWNEQFKNLKDNEKFIWDYSDESPYKKSIYKGIFDKEHGNKLSDICKNNSLLIYTFLVSTLKITLSKYMGKNDIVIGIPCYSNQNARANMHINKLLPLVSCIDHEMTYLEYMGSIKAKVLNNYKNQAYLNSKALVQNGLSNDVMELTPISICMKGIHEDKDVDYICESNKNELSFLLYPMEDKSIDIQIVYNSNKITEVTVKALYESYITALKDVLNNYNKKIKDIKILSEDDTNKILFEFNDTKADYPKDKTIYELFEAQVEKMPDNIAVVFEDKSLTYRELNERANSLARVLRDKAVKADSIVGIMLERSIEMIVGIMGILKAGGAYLPIDLDYPKERIEYMLSDSGSKLLLSQKKFVENVEFNGESIDVFNEDLFINDSSNLNKINYSTNLAYVIYTSGTTGNPKGVMIEHRTLNNYVEYAKNNYSIEEELYMPLYTSVSFDLTVTSVFTPLISGKSIIIYNETEPDSLTKAVFSGENQSVIKLTPAHLSLLKEIKTVNKSIKRLIVGGETLTEKLAKQISGLFENKIEIINEYGPTEATVGCIVHKYNYRNKYRNSVLIGKPISNTKIYILDINNKLLPIGVVGEIYIGGDVLARGYLNREELTREKFIENPFEPGTKMYKTGDLARWLPDGNIEFLGRIDNQVKIRGFRIELGEIENRLLEHEDVKEAAVLVKENKDGEKYICAYVVSDKKFQELDLKGYLKETLPEYMIPAYFMELEKMPLTTNGKLDRRALPEPNLDTTLTEYEAPRNEIEEALAKIWSEVLGVKKIGINDNFFDLGGHSLKAITLVSKAHKEMNVEVPIKELFKNPTIKELAKVIEDLSESRQENIEPIPEQEYYKLSSSQSQMYTLQQFDEESTNYNISGAMEIEGKLNVEKLEDAFRTLISRHEILRSSFHEVDLDIMQRVNKDVAFELVRYNAVYEEVEEIISNFIKPFDLSKGPLLRAGIIELADGDSAYKKQIFIFDMHHIIADGISMDILVKEVVSIYEGKKLPELSIQYKDFAYWQNKQMEQTVMKQQERYWMECFKGELPVLNLATDYVRPTIREIEGSTIETSLEKNLTQKLKKLASDTGTTLQMVLLGAFNVLLYKYTGQNDIIVGTPVAGRNHIDLQNLIGMFVNTLALRNYPTDDKTFIDFLGELKANTLDAYENQRYPFEKLVEKLDIPKDLSRNPLFDVMFVLQNTLNSEIKIDGARISPFRFGSKVSKFDLQLEAFEDNDVIRFVMNFATKLFKEETVKRMMGHLENILERVTQDPRIKLGEVDMLSEDERNLILFEYNNIEDSCDRYKTLNKLFEEQVKKTPHNEALICGEEVLTYSELHVKSNQVAHYLKAHGVKPGEAVGLLEKRCPGTIINLLGILKSGGCYVPIDSNYPQDRADYILADSGCRLMLEASEELEQVVSSYPLEDIMTGGSAEVGAYVIYTSGGTGKPKSIVITHEAAVNTIININRKFNINEKDKIIGLSPLCFELSVYDIFGALSAGAALVQVPDQRDTNVLYEVLKTQNITVWSSAPVIMDRMISRMNSDFSDYNLRLVLLNGNWIPIRRSDKIKDHFKNAKVVSLGGAMEGSIWSIHYPIMEMKNEWKSIPYDIQLVNQKFFVLDSNKRLCPIGVPGELYIGCAGPATNYRNDDKRTTNTFIWNSEQGYLHKTDDYGVLRRPSGCNEIAYIEFLGRKDSQVKIKGYSVEVGEIEACLRRYSQVKEAVVLDKKDLQGIKCLYAYIVSEGEVDNVKLKTYLLGLLPHYMIPQEIVNLDSMPITQDNKIDRRTLQSMEGSQKNNLKKGEYAAPANRTQEQLVAMWKEVLNIKDRISIKDNFFDIGGHSLSATLLVSKLRKEMDVTLGTKEIFQYPTIETIANFIDATAKQRETEIEILEKKEYYDCSSAQKRMFFINQIEGASTAYNNPLCFTVLGDFKAERLQEAFCMLIERHEALRTSFELQEGEVKQKVHESVDFDMIYLEEREENFERVAKDFIRPFDLSKAPLIRTQVVKISHNKHRLLFDMNHIISDGISMWILVEELIAFYEGKSLPPLKIQYKDYAAWQNRLFETEVIRQQEAYWLEVLKGNLNVINLPYDYPRPHVQSFEGSSITFSLEKELVDRLKAVCKQNGATLYMVLLAAVNVLLYKYTGQEDIIIGSPIAGRSHADSKGIIGMFVNTLAMRNYPEGSKTFQQFIEEVKKNALDAYDNQEYQFETLLEKLDIRRDIGRNPLFDIAFVLQNMDTRDMETDTFKFVPYEVESNISKFDLTIIAEEKGAGIDIILEYCTKLFKRETIARLYSHFKSLLDIITENVDIRIKDIDLLSQEEKMKLLYAPNDTSCTYPSEMTINQIFEQQVQKTPENIALVFEDQQLNYRQLNDRANQLARILRSKGICPDTIVAVMVERSIELIVGMLAVLKAGGAYLPIDPEYPDDRIHYTLQDSGAKILLTQKNLLDTVQFEGISICVEDESIYSGEAADLENICTPSSLAYVIYTSGTTGKPKGVMIEHVNVVRLIYNDSLQFDFSEQDIWTMFHSACFDFSVWEMYGALLYGGKLVVIPKKIARSTGMYLELLKKHKVTVLNQTPSAFYNLINEEMKANDRELMLRYVIFGGEALKPLMLKQWKEKYTNTKLINMYGITETTVHVTFHEVTDKDMELNTSNIGKPIPTTTVYIMDKNSRLLPVGVAGEMFVGGDGVGRGYLNRSALTAERFVENPYKPGERLYRSGDLARFLPDGNMEYLGRADNQVKIRGFRIELGEIESQLLKHVSIKEAVVVMRERSSNDRYLCAYIVSKEQLFVTQLKQYLSKFLPDYMIPSYFVEINKLPLTSNGKVDIRALPDAIGNIQVGVEYVPPKSDIEKKLVEIWQKVLGVERVGIDESFFDLGGNSLLILQMHTEIEKCFPGKVTVANIFAYPTISKLAEYIDENAEKENRQISFTYVKLPEEYMADGDYEDSTFEFNLTGELYEKITTVAQHADTDTYGILLSLYAYMISQVSETPKITVQAMVKTQGEVTALDMDMTYVEDIPGLISLVEQVQHETKDPNRYDIKEILECKQVKNNGDVLPLFYKKDRLSLSGKLTEVYDMVLEVWDQEDGIEFAFDYDARRMDGKRQEKLINNYINLIRAVGNSFKK
ncbi:non-ribosomal peptide synthetase [Clostridium sp. UBA2485]|uniref:non-ribosomal peptide synthetase n=1 Tax=Clostridium sp. UBA2485 TaxID=1946352 RepID=UPI0025C13D83|nr:non-ribosomal peptide synthetase [Clostridium sp. UBA2485]